MTAPVSKYDIYEADLDSLIIEVAGTPHPHALLGYGYGSRDAMQKYTHMDPSWKGAWYQNLINIQNGFEDSGGILVSLTDAAWLDQQVDKRYRAIYSFDDLGIQPDPGDFITLHPLDETAALLLVQNAEISPNKKITLDLGKRKFDEIDAFNAKNSLVDAYATDYLSESANSISNSGQLTMGDDNNGWGTPWNSGSFTVPAAVNNASNNCRVTMDFSMKLTSYVCVGEATVYFTINGIQKSLSYFHHYKIGDTVSGIDITSMVNFGTASTLIFYARVNGVWVGGLPTATVNATIHAWRRVTRV